PADAVLLSGASSQPIAVFARRALYVCVDKDELARHGYGRHGYGMSCWLEYKVMKRYDAKRIVHRRHILELAVADRIGPAEASKVLDALQRLDRPFILHTRGDSGFQSWLKDNGIGRAIFNSANDTVWLVDRADLEKAHAERLSAR